MNSDRIEQTYMVIFMLSLIKRGRGEKKKLYTHSIDIILAVGN